MADEKKSVRRGIPASNARQISAILIRESLSVIKEQQKAGKSNLIQGYGATMWINDFLYSGLLISKQCYDDVRIIATIMQAISGLDALASIFSNTASPFMPQLKTNVEQSGGDRGEGDDAALKAAINAASTLALEAAI